MNGREVPMPARKKPPHFFVVPILLICCVLMYFVDAYLRPTYYVKSALKIFIFGIIPIFYSLLDPAIQLKPLLRIRKKQSFLKSMLLGIVIYFGTLAAYFALRSDIDLNTIADHLSTGQGITKDNFLFICLYISFFNSFLEEFFFRGFAYLSTRRILGRKFSSVLSAACFSLYHFAMLGGWFPNYIFIAVLLALFAGGLLFNKLDDKSSTIYNSWIVHMFLNFGINTVGALIFIK